MNKTENDTELVPLIFCRNQFFLFSCWRSCFLERKSEIHAGLIFVGFVIFSNNTVLNKLIAEIWENVDITKSNRSVWQGKKHEQSEDQTGFKQTLKE